MIHSTLLCRAVFCLMIASPILVMAQTTYYAVESPDGTIGNLLTVDLVTGNESNVMPVMLNGNTVDGCTGMALDPTSGDVYVVAKTGNVFTLGTIDLATGTVTASTTLPDKFSAIAFDNAGTLYGLTGDGANTPETLFEIDPGTGNTSVVAQPGTGTDGEALAFNSSNGLLYRYGGGNIFQSIDPANATVTDIFLNGATVDDYAHALVYSNGSFVFAAGSSMYTVSASGTTQLVSNLPNGTPGYKGLVSTLSVGVTEGQVAKEPILRPNPTTGTIWLDLPADRYSYRIIDASGRDVMRGVVQQGTGIDAGILPEGPYTLLWSSEGKEGTVRFVKQ